MIIVEGPDNVGKSTLIKQLIELDPSLRVLHRDRYWPSRGESIATSYLRALVPTEGDRTAHNNGIADRMFASECIYGALFRDGCRMTDGEHFAIRNVLNSYDAIAVHCDAPDETILENWKSREQLYDDPLLIARAYRQRFAEIFATNALMRYDWTSPHALQMRKDIIALHHAKREKMRRALAWWSAMPYGVGQLRHPRVILIGESSSPQAKTSVPFANGPAGDFLAWTIARTQRIVGDWLARDIYVTNAEKGTQQDAAILREELAFLVHPTRTVVITLGREAERMLEYVRPSLSKQPVAITNLPHPMFWRRFHWENRREYVRKFSNALTQIARMMA